ncbi:iron dicitrate transport regulator FecR [Chitinophaga caeni]|uniref:Iron dicitrate transport regulator FecR n=1 Tax=Chitinophaga caeni TaxID=2029983 RepID=A0A291QY60_9BACT|nr:FecR family protein [Chitinophaga caeni]ATL48880.1 iron dicitrate transport regulator FecR [Chitinophaga caeni]
MASQLESLFIKYIRNECSHKELQELHILSSLEENREELRALFETYVHTDMDQAMIQLPRASSERILNNVLASGPLKNKNSSNVRKLVLRWSWAAAILILAVVGISLWKVSKNRADQAIQQPNSSDIPAGTQGAVLTLADGSQITLDSLQNGSILNQEGTKARVQQGLLSYSDQAGTPVYNTLSTPRGRQFQLNLPDGSRVWLNAESAITFPTSFEGNSRIVSIQGEAYFEIAQNAQQAFIVEVNNKLKIEVLGTAFNVNAYESEPVIGTTLLNGAVRVLPKEHQQKSLVLKPGEQANWQHSEPGSHFELRKNVNLDNIIAWKEGFFNLEGVPFDELMRQIERWYDIKVVYAGQVPNIRLFGKLGRDKSLDNLLKALTYYEVHFKREGRQLTILEH